MHRVQILLEMEELPQRRHRDDEAGDAAEDRAGDEVRPEHRRVPHRHRRHREVERDDRVDRDRDRDDRDRHDLHCRFESVPLARRAAPAECECAVDPSAQAGGAIAHEREVRNHRQHEKEDAAGQIRVDGEEIPHERRPEIRPDLPVARIRYQPEEQPRPAEMNDGKQRANHQREHGDHFRAARHRPPPAGVHEPEDRGDQRARMADADPEDEIGDVERPEDRVVDPGDPEAVVHLVRPGAEACQDDAAEECDERVETPRRPQQRTQQIVAELARRGFAHTCVWRSR